MEHINAFIFYAVQKWSRRETAKEREKRWKKVITPKSAALKIGFQRTRVIVAAWLNGCAYNTSSNNSARARACAWAGRKKFGSLVWRSDGGLTNFYDRPAGNLTVQNAIRSGAIPPRCTYSVLPMTHIILYYYMRCAGKREWCPWTAII